MEKKMIFLFFIIFPFSFNSELYVYQPSEVISFFKQKSLPQDECESMKNSLKKILYDYYAFYEIAKNPPQPDFDPNYHPKVDLEEELDQLETKNRDIYTFYQDLKKIIAKTRDGHFSLSFGDIPKYFMNFTIISPLQLIISHENGKEYLYGDILTEDEEIQKAFRNSDTLFNIIEDNKDVKIASINGMDPFDFISDFGKDYYNLRSPHANFFFKWHILPFLYLLPMSSEELIDFNVTYENGDSFTTNFIILSEINIKENKTENLLNSENTNKFSLYNINQYRNNLEKLINKKNNLKILKEEDIIKWDYEFEDIFKCRVDETNEINVYFINSFIGKDNDLYNNTIVKCAQLFDKNTYPITFISNFNPGGRADICHTLLETISPLIKINYYAAVRKTDNCLKNAEKYKWKVLSTEKCEKKSIAEFIKNGGQN